MTPSVDPGLVRVFSEIGVPENRPFVPDPFQEAALEAVETRDCLVTAPTGAGKTWIAETATQRHLEQQGRIWYATPLKALTNTIYARFRDLFGRDRVGILTGDKKENREAPIIIGTTEILRNQLYDAMHTGQDLDCSLVIMDEAHYLGDAERGVVWEEILIYLPARVSLLMLSATIGNAVHIADWLGHIRGKTCRIVQEHHRPVPLFPLFLHPQGRLLPLFKGGANRKTDRLHPGVVDYMKTRKPLQISRPGQLPPFADILSVMKTYDLLPAIFFLKSRSDCDKAAALCSSRQMDETPERRNERRRCIQHLVKGVPHLSGHAQRSLLERMAVGSHHSGQLPAWKVVVETLMARGLLDAMFATSTVAAGVNFPARSVVILNSDRFNGVTFLPLTPSEFQQMTGRAGRRGMDNIGFALVLPGKFMDLPHVAKMVSAPPMDVQSRIRIDFSLVLNLLLSHNPRQVRALLENSFAAYMMEKGKRGRYARRAFGENLQLLWQDFLDHLAFLQEEGFVTGQGALTDDGMWASQLRIDQPLMVAHCLRRGIFPDRDPALLAAVMAAFVNEKEFDDEAVSPDGMPRRVMDTFVRLRKGLHPFAHKLLDNGFAAPNLYLQPAAAVFSWAMDHPWETVVKRFPFADGDLARLILRTGENLRQLAGVSDTFPEVARTALEAVDLLYREPVVSAFDESL